MEDGYFIIYVSFRKIVCSEADIEQILLFSQLNNIRDEITGFLLYNENMFVQFLEGEEVRVKNLYQHILKDERHANPIVLHEGGQHKRVFDEWHMAEKKSDWDFLDFKSTISDHAKTRFMSLVNGQESSEVIDTIAKIMR